LNYLKTNLLILIKLSAYKNLRPLDEKKKLRRKYLKIRKELSDDYVSQSSRLIIQRVLESAEYRKARTIHCYVSIIENKEVYTQDLIKLSLQKGKKVVVPKMVGNKQLSHIYLKSMDDLALNDWNVPEPRSNDEADISELDLILVPMVAGDRHKNRLGYGQGYYDRFLNRSNCKKMGLLFSCQLTENKLPVDPFDVPMDIMITENERIE